MQSMMEMENGNDSDDELEDETNSTAPMNGAAGAMHRPHAGPCNHNHAPPQTAPPQATPPQPTPT